MKLPISRTPRMKTRRSRPLAELHHQPSMIDHHSLLQTDLCRSELQLQTNPRVYSSRRFNSWTVDAKNNRRHSVASACPFWCVDHNHTTLHPSSEEFPLPRRPVNTWKRCSVSRWTLFFLEPQANRSLAATNKLYCMHDAGLRKVLTHSFGIYNGTYSTNNKAREKL